MKILNIQEMFLTLMTTMMTYNMKVEAERKTEKITMKKRIQKNMKGKKIRIEKKLLKRLKISSVSKIR